VSFGLYWDLVWLFDEAQAQAFLQLPLEAFGGGRAGRALAFAQVYALQGRAVELRRASVEAERAYASDLAGAPDDEQSTSFAAWPWPTLGGGTRPSGKGNGAWR